MANTSTSDEQNQAATETLKFNEKLVNGVTDQKDLDEKDKILKSATLLFLQGKRSVFIRDYQAAVAALSESCQLLDQILPTQDEALADPYFYYGKALLELERSESEVLGDQIQDADNDDDDDEEEEDDEDEEEDKNGEKPKSDAAEANGDAEKNESKSVNTPGKSGESSSGKENADGDENEEVNDLQLSWEYLELAKLIYSKKADTCKETAIKLAETYLCLGENGLESENYPGAIADMKQALELQKKHLPPEDRRIAETLYQMGIAHSLDQNYDEAISCFKNSIEQLERKISSLEIRKKMGDKKTEEEEKDAFYTMDWEIDEIKGVIKDVEEKIKDMADCKNQVKEELLKKVTSGGGQAGSTSSSEATQSSNSSSIPARDISHLVRKKRKNDEEEAGQDKKTKTET